MDDDWDLQAVVRGCAAAIAATTTVSTTRTAAAAAATDSNSNHLPNFPSNLPYHDDSDSFVFSGLVDEKNDPFQGLQDTYGEFNLLPTTAAAATCDISAAGIVPVQFPFVLPPQQHFMQVRPPYQLNMQMLENMQFNINPTPAQNFPASISQPIRPRRRKNQQIKMVRQMTQEELTADSWAWRKYGQKPIKGSPYPRNYYRCSTSKGCAARKQVERSSSDPEVFVVSYSGEHTHPRPSHRNSLSGSIKSRFASPPPKTSGGGGVHPISSQKSSMPSSSSSPTAGANFDPVTPAMEGEALTQNDVRIGEEDDGNGDEMITSPNDLMNEDDDIFRAFQDSDDHSSSGGDFFNGGLLSSAPWTPSSSGGNSNAFNGGGCT